MNCEQRGSVEMKNFAEFMMLVSPNMFLYAFKDISVFMSKWAACSFQGHSPG